MSKKTKLLEKVQRIPPPKDFTWDEAMRLMNSCNFQLHNKKGSARMFLHEGTKTKVRLHERHPQKTLLPYMVDALLEGLRAAGELDE